MAGIIKAGQMCGGASEPRPAAYQLADVADQANAYISAARAQAQEILAAARRDADGIRQRAEQQGMQAAAAKSEQIKRREVSTQLQSLVPAIEKSVQSFVEVRQNWVQAWEAAAVRLACAIASRVIRHEVELQPDVSMQLLRESLELASGSSAMRIHLHPDDHATLGTEARRLCDAWNRAVNVEICADPEVPKGSCRVTTEFGDIDQRFQQQLARIQQELTQ
jgi:flagellar assembly protein FliH